MTKKDKPWYVYMVRCQNKALYTGISDDVAKRVKKHNDGKGAKAVKAHGLPVALVWSQEFETKSLALKEECRIKKLTKKKKEKMVKDI